VSRVEDLSPWWLDQAGSLTTTLHSSRLAELMLPDGAHLRGEDWTIFYLGQTASSAVAPMFSHEELRSSANANATASTSTNANLNPRASMMLADADDRPKRGSPGGGLLYVLNCVRCKEDKTVRRGAQVKAMAIATHHPYIQIYKVGPGAGISCARAVRGRVCRSLLITVR
jgi:hypothetical protein